MSWGFGGKIIGTWVSGPTSATITGVPVGSLLVVSFSGYDPNTDTFTCSDGSNTYTQGPSEVDGSANFKRSTCFYAVVTTGGSLSVSVGRTTPTLGGSIGVTWFSVAAGSAISLVTSSFNWAAGPPAKSGASSYSGAGNFLVWANENGGGSAVAGTGGAVNYTQGNLVGAAYAVNDEYLLNAPTANSPITPYWSSETTVWSAVSLVFRETLATAKLFLPATLSLGAGGPFFQSGVNS